MNLFSHTKYNLDYLPVTNGQNTSKQVTSFRRNCFFLLSAIIYVIFFLYWLIRFKEANFGWPLLILIPASIFTFAIIYVIPLPKQISQNISNQSDNVKTYLSNYKIPKEPLWSVEFTNNQVFEIPLNQPIIIWLKENMLYFASPYYYEDFGVYGLSLDKISFFSRKGDFYIETKSEVKRTGRITGALIAGGSGFATGTNSEIVNTTNEIDKRSTYLYLNNGTDTQVISFSSDSYSIFMKLIPQFEYDNIATKSQSANVVNINESPDIDIKLKQIANLKESGLITEEEYNAKKAEILSRL